MILSVGRILSLAYWERRPLIYVFFILCFLDETYYFNCEKWFSVEGEDGRIEREMTVTEGGLGFSKVRPGYQSIPEWAASPNNKLLDLCHCHTRSSFRMTPTITCTVKKAEYSRCHTRRRLGCASGCSGKDLKTCFWMTRLITLKGSICLAWIEVDGLLSGIEREIYRDQYTWMDRELVQIVLSQGNACFQSLTWISRDIYQSLYCRGPP